MIVTRACVVGFPWDGLHRLYRWLDALQIIATNGHALITTMYHVYIAIEHSKSAIQPPSESERSVVRAADIVDICIEDCLLQLRSSISKLANQAQTHFSLQKSASYRKAMITS